LLSFLSASSAIQSTNETYPAGRVLFSAITILTLRPSELTTNRRVPPVPQAVCAYPHDVCNTLSANISVVRCHKDASTIDPECIQWFCTAPELDPQLVGIASVSIDCEGYGVDGDAWVLRGSCGVRFSLIPTKDGREKLGLPSSEHKNSEAVQVIIWVLLVLVGVLLLLVLLRGMYLVYQYRAELWRKAHNLQLESSERAPLLAAQAQSRIPDEERAANGHAYGTTEH
jgi:hypothetical protein